MAPRTRATVLSAPANAIAPLAAAPRRRVRVTPLEKETSIAEEPKPATRSTRSNKVDESAEEPKKPTVKAAATKTRGRPKKAQIEGIEEAEPEKPVEILTEKRKRATRSTRATATTASFTAKEKPTARPTRAAKGAARDEGANEAKQAIELTATESAPAKTAAKKKVTFQDVYEDDKENLPITTRGGKKVAAAKKPAEKVTGLRARPIRNPTAKTATRATKRTKDQASDDEDEKPKKKIQRVLTPKKITQLARAATPEDASEDELNGAKTPIRDLSLSPRRPQTTTTAEAATKTLSPAKKFDFSQPLLQQSAKKKTGTALGTLVSPARRPEASTTKLFQHSTIASPAKGLNGLSNALASPARRPDSPAKLLFPNATKHDTRMHLLQGAGNLFQSPKRSTGFDPARIFAHSAIKPQKNELTKSSFLSSPAKRAGEYSPTKVNVPQSTSRSVLQTPASSDDLALNETEVIELINEGTVEVSVSSHQRASTSPARTYKVTEDELDMDFDESILPVRSPLKLIKSPVKAPAMDALILTTEVDEDEIAVISSEQGTPTVKTPRDTSFVNPHVLDIEDSSIEVRDQAEDTLETEPGSDDTIVLSEVVAEATPRPCIASNYDHDTSFDELAPSPSEDVVAKFLRMPGTPATLQEHELIDIKASPEVGGTPVARQHTQLQDNTESPASLHENELTMMGDASIAVVESSGRVAEVEESIICLHENELTLMAGTPKPASRPRSSADGMVGTPASVYESELTMIAANFTPRTSRRNPAQSPASLHEDEMTTMASTQNITIILSEAKVGSPAVSVASLHEHEMTTVGVGADVKSIASPASVAEHEITVMADLLPEDVTQAQEKTPFAAPVKHDTFTPDLPIPRKFNLHTVVSKVPLKPEGQDSPFKLQLKKRKRPFSLGGQPESGSVTWGFTPIKSARTVSSPDATASRGAIAETSAPSAVYRTTDSKLSSVKSARRATSNPVARTPLSPVTVVSSILEGATICIDVRTSEGVDASTIYIDLLSGLGAKVVKEWKDDLTHVVFKDGNMKILEKARSSDSSVKVVGVAWPLDCEAQKTWVDETDYLLNLSPTDLVINSVTKSVRRKSMEPSTLIADGSGSVKRSRSRSRASSIRRSSIKPLAFEGDDTPKSETVDSPLAISTPQVSTAKKHANLHKHSLTAAWKSINATQNLGDDTPARRTLELLQKSYQLENDWDTSIISNEDDDNDENTPQPEKKRITEEDADESIIDTGLTPAPYRTQVQIGSAPTKINNAGMMSYRERVEEMERREMRDNAFGTNKGARGVGKNKAKRMTMFGFEGA